MRAILPYLAALFMLILLALFMKRDKEKTEDENLPQIVKKVDVYELRKGWHIKEAKYIYRLYSGQLLTWGDGHESMQNTYGPDDFFRHNGEGWEFIGGGNLSWAKRQAKHYGIDVHTEATE